MNSKKDKTQDPTPDCCGGEDCCSVGSSRYTRRDFLSTGAKAGLFLSTLGGLNRPLMGATPEEIDAYLRLTPEDKKLDPEWVRSLFERGEKDVYSSDAAMRHVGMPVGGIFTGTVYLGGDGRLWHWDIFNSVSYGITPEDFVYEGRDMKYYWGSNYAYPLEQTFPFRQEFAIRANGKELALSGDGFRDVTFRGEYPRAIVSYENADLPVSARLEAFSPFCPLNENDSGLPATVMEFTVKNEGSRSLDMEVVGYLENAVCLLARNFQSGTIRNRVVEGTGFTGVECSAQTRKGVARGQDREAMVFENFDEGAAERWTGKGSAFADSKLFGIGTGEINTYKVGQSNGVKMLAADAIRRTGILTSQSFKIERQYITTEVSGDFNPAKSGLSVIVNGKIVATASGNYSTTPTSVSLDVSHYEGRDAYLEIRDEVTKREPHMRNAGGISVGPIVFSDTPVGEVVRLETLPDFGTMTLSLLGENDVDRASALSGKNRRQAEGELGESLEGEVGRSATLAPGEEAVFTFVVSWFFPNYSNYHMGSEDVGHHYASRFNSSSEATAYLAEHSERLFSQTRNWVNTWYDSSLPYWFLDRTMSNTSTLATATCHRFKDGRFWGWEGIACCSGTCTHVWQYAQTMARLFPAIERETRDKVDFGLGQHENGGIAHRINVVPHPIIADDGQLGRILSVYREHQMTADHNFLRTIWPRVKKAMEFIIDKNDPDLDGMLEGDQRNTLDGIWYGKISWFSSLYAAALKAMERMAIEVGDTVYAARCRRLGNAAKRRIDDLFNGEYFIQIKTGKTERWHTEGSGKGCFIDQIFGQSWAHWVGLGHVIDKEKQLSALYSIYRYNFIPDYGPFREEFSQGRILAQAGDAGLLMCTWPKEPVGEHELSEKYFFEYMTGFEWQVASHMIHEGLENPDLLEHGLAISRAIHDRYKAELRNPYNEVECSDHYSRAMASYGAYQSICGYKYHGPKGELSFAPRLRPEDFRAAFTTAEGWGTYSQQIEGKTMNAQVRLKWGSLKLNQISLYYNKGLKPQNVLVTFNGEPLPASIEYSNGMSIITLENKTAISHGEEIDIKIS